MALKKTNIEEKLCLLRNKQANETVVMEEVKAILSQKTTLEKIKTKGTTEINYFNFDLLDTSKIYHVDQIKEICITYRLRFLCASIFKAPLPTEALDKVKALELEHGVSIKNLSLMAPAKFFQLKSADDPLLFAPMGNGYYYLIHKWGNDLSSFRKIAMLPFKNFLNLLIFLSIVSIIITKALPLSMFTKKPEPYMFWVLLLFVMKGFIGLSLYFSFAQGKSVSNRVWNKKYFNAW
ncbi:hypothetical protein [Neptunitalea lumnitzerae]|uniref:Uncharacterized protein n=1 Tax=Neptunitalea lumnitzerae TaxID=2965509 RepID=A0ABQ5MIK4_9FLAO|nr:hypothetical protein [Neptunitalea sp. Y10]GLB49229.1 hypothetical protein Y10_15970 [Neptunitalea sp. Y10]